MRHTATGRLVGSLRQTETCPCPPSHPLYVKGASSRSLLLTTSQSFQHSSRKVVSAITPVSGGVWNDDVGGNAVAIAHTRSFPERRAVNSGNTQSERRLDMSQTSDTKTYRYRTGKDTIEDRGYRQGEGSKVKVGA